MNTLVFLFMAVHIENVISCVAWLLPDDIPPDCCESKTYGDLTFKYVSWEDTSTFECDTPCVYSEVAVPNSRYCFKTGGSTQTKCYQKEVNIDWYDGMEPVKECVSPGTSVIFNWPKDSTCYNVNKIPESDYQNCDVDNTECDKSGKYSFEALAAGTFFFADGTKCAKGGMKATIVVDNDCKYVCKSDAEVERQSKTALAILKHDLDLRKKFLSDQGHLNADETLTEFFALNKIFLSPDQRNIMLHSNACSSVRDDCGRCFDALIYLDVECGVDKQHGHCLIRLAEANITCKSCVCEISKTCDRYFNCNKAVLSESTECDRTCTGTEAMRCVFDFSLELLKSTDVDGPQGNERHVLAYNKQIPGPPIVICEGDELVVNLVNNIDPTLAKQLGFNDTTTLHFHGIREIRRPWSDGVPWVTQYPIPPGGNFTYGFNAINYWGAPPGTYNQAGTFWYHSHVSAQRTNGAYGALIIRSNVDKDNLPPGVHIDDIQPYDWDDSDNTIILQEWYDTNDQYTQKIASLLINGNSGVPTDNTIIKNYTVFNIKELGKRHIFRIIGAISENVPLRLSIEDHKFTAIATDGQEIEPVTDLDELWIAGGERFDIVVTAKDSSSPKEQPYKIRVLGFEDPPHETGKYCTIAWLKYPDQTVDNTIEAVCSSLGFNPSSPQRTLNPVPNKKEWANQLQFSEWNNTNTTGNIFIKNLRAKKYNPSLYFFPDDHLLDTLVNSQYIDMPSFSFNGFKMTYPEIPFLLQDPAAENNRCGRVCDLNVFSPTNVGAAEKEKYITSHCTDRNHVCDGQPTCSCEHVLEEPYVPGYWVEIVLINNNVSGIAHPIHLHGGWFWVIGMHKYEFNINRTFITNEDNSCGNKPCLPRNLHHLPPSKDTIQVPPGGYVIMRAQTNNKGTWFMHCHINKHLNSGMAMVLQIGGQLEIGKDNYDGQDWCTGPLGTTNATTTAPTTTRSLLRKSNNAQEKGSHHIDWHFGMESTKMCVTPGIAVIFHVANDKNVLEVTKMEFEKCEANNISPSDGDFTWIAPSAPQKEPYYFISGTGNGADCLAGMKADIIVNKNCL